MVKKYILMLCVALFFVSPVHAFSNNYEKLIPQRVAYCWVEGQALGELILGARGKITIVYVDEALKKALTQEGTTPPSWLKEQAAYIMPHPKKLGFVILIEANKPWDFSIGELKIAGNILDESHLLTKKERVPDGELESGFSEAISVSIPAGWAKRGKPLVIAYGDDTAELLLPKR